MPFHDNVKWNIWAGAAPIPPHIKRTAVNW
jgi:hypothetical protein